MSRLGMFACLLMLVAVVACLDMPPNLKALEQPKDGVKLDNSRRDPQMPPPRPEGSRPDAPRAEGRPDLQKGDNPKPDAKAPQDGKS